MSIVKVGSGEYWNVFLEDNGCVYGHIWNGKTWPYTQYQLLSDIIDVQGGQYSCIALDKNGVAWELFPNGANKKITLPNGIAYAQMMNQAKLLIDKSGDLYYLAEDAGIDKDAMNLGTVYISKTPVLLLKGSEVAKIALSENLYGILLLTKDGTAFVLKQGKTVPSLVATQVTDIAMIRGAYIIINNLNEIYAWGINMNYITAFDAPKVQSSGIKINGYWPNVKYPIKQIAGSWNTLHIIDANNDLYGAGENIQGEVGNGKGCLEWKNYKGADGKTLQPFQWNWLPGQMIQAPVKLDGKWKQICKSGSMAFQNYAQDLKGQWYSWGRDKNRALSSGYCFSPNDPNNYISKYPNWSDLWYPMPCNPNEITDWKLITSFNPSTAPNNAPFKPIPPEPEPPKQVDCELIIKGRHWWLYEDGTSKSSLI